MKIVHIGLMKSGTTYLQNAFAYSRVELKKRGILYPGNEFNQQHACYGLCGAYIPWVSPCRRWDAMGKSMLREIQSHAGDVLVTSEALSSMNAEGIAHFCDQMLGIDRVVITVRNFTKTLLSAWQQSIKGGGKSALNDFFKRLERDREQKNGLWRTYSFGEIAQKWSRHADVELIVVGGHSDSNRDPLLATFSYIIGIPLGDPGALSESERNISLHFEDVEVLRHINMLFESTPKRERERMIRGILRHHFFPVASSKDGKSIAISPDYAKKVEMWAEKEIEALPSEISVHGNLDHVVTARGAPVGELERISRDESFRRFVEIVGSKGRK